MLPEKIDLGTEVLHLVSEFPIRYETWEYFIEFDSEEEFNEWLAKAPIKIHGAL